MCSLPRTALPVQTTGKRLGQIVRFDVDLPDSPLPPVNQLEHFSQEEDTSNRGSNSALRQPARHVLENLLEGNKRFQRVLCSMSCVEQRMVYACMALLLHPRLCSGGVHALPRCSTCSCVNSLLAKHGPAGIHGKLLCACMLERNPSMPLAGRVHPMQAGHGTPGRGELPGPAALSFPSLLCCRRMLMFQQCPTSCCSLPLGVGRICGIAMGDGASRLLPW